jgi:hypothetical protein
MRSGRGWLTVTSDAGGTFHGGVLRSSVRVEIRIASPSLWFADAFTHTDGKEVQIQSYRFVRSSD